MCSISSDVTIEVRATHCWGSSSTVPSPESLRHMWTSGSPPAQESVQTSNEVSDFFFLSLASLCKVATQLTIKPLITINSSSWLGSLSLKGYSWHKWTHSYHLTGRAYLQDHFCLHCIDHLSHSAPPLLSTSMAASLEMRLSNMRAIEQS